MTHFVCAVCVMKLVCACDSVLLVPCLWREGGMSMLSYFVSAYVCAASQKQCNSFHLCSKG